MNIFGHNLEPAAFSITLILIAIILDIIVGFFLIAFKKDKNYKFWSSIFISIFTELVFLTFALLSMIFSNNTDTWVYFEIFTRLTGAFLFIFMSVKIVSIYFYTSEKTKVNKMYGFSIMFFLFLYSMFASIPGLSELFYTFDNAGHIIDREHESVRSILLIVPCIIGAIFFIRYAKYIGKINSSVLMISIISPSAFIFMKNYEIAFGISVLMISISTLTSALLTYQSRILLLNKKEDELNNAQSILMLSQIKPHFLYNTLASISYLCEEDPNKAKELIDDFSQYLRYNLSSANTSEKIDFSLELEHIKTYLKIEKLRFGNRLNVITFIKSTDFEVPVLSIQPLVENAVKHGVCQKEEGGTVILTTYSHNNGNYLIIEDNGVGFETNLRELDKKKHIGISNAKERIHNISKGTFDIQSTVGEGTKITIFIPNKTN